VRAVSDPVLQVSDLTKRYRATVALEDVSFGLNAGEVCGLLGENGAGKSTLVKILSGVVEPDHGSIRLRGSPFSPSSIVEANRLGISTAFQELSLVPSLSVAVNLALPHPQRNGTGLVSAAKVRRQAETILARYGATDIRPDDIVGQLPLGVRQRVEIIRALARDPSVLLLDEPTSALSDRDWLFRLLDQVLGEGISILYISHKLDEIRRLCRRCIILRNGRKVLDSDLAAMSDDELFANMAGRSVVETFTRRASAVRAASAPRLAVENLAGPGIDGVSFALAPGECLGVAGLEGQGQSALFRTLVGLSPATGGSIALDGATAPIRSAREARAKGVVLVPEDRKAEGIFRDLSTLANISLPVISEVSRLGLVDRGAERKAVAGVTPAVDLAEPMLDRSINALSGGNQQKAILARALVTGARCLLLFDPTRGVDVGAKQSIYAMMAGFLAKGGAILFYSTELDELVHLCDRVLVVYRRRIAGEVHGADLTQSAILALASGADARPAARAPSLAGAAH
jgi:ribose transport system ATP-binding protein